MRRLLLLVLIILVAYNTKPYWEEHIDPSILEDTIAKLESFKEKPEVQDALAGISDRISSIIYGLEDSLQEVKEEVKEPNNDAEAVEVSKPELSKPEDQVFSVHNLEIGDTKEYVEQTVGTPVRSTVNEYGIEWHAYHQGYRNFLMVSFDENDQVSALYTNQDLIASDSGIGLNSSKDEVHKTLGEPISKIRKGLVYYQLQNDGEYEMYQRDDSYITVFYDKHENNTVTALQIIDEDLEHAKKDIYSDGNDGLKEGFEYQLFDLTNATRVNHGLPVLTWDEHVRSTARKHSLDMADNNYFNHTNLEGQSPFDRMQEDNITFTVAGENLAYGQFSSIFAHEGLMNSEGHRKNILKEEYEFLGVGVAFNQESQPYYTENFYRD
ncbi:CAP domain-containing protein [Bacillus sp. SG-1]|uniref:CAP domain-containing protein n=1 Tax=Bacillus sp. SG-1 TaxID=161544 RepID=UPI0002F8FCFC|nr:CAP domain-containing protein [Bacillus sp. SG-1]